MSQHNQFNNAFQNSSGGWGNQAQQDFPAFGQQQQDQPKQETPWSAQGYVASGANANWGQQQQAPNQWSQQQASASQASPAFYPGQQTQATATSAPAQTASTPAASFPSFDPTAFKASSTNFVPQGRMAITQEEFPELDGGFEAAPKKKQVVKGPTKAELDAKKEAENAALPTKGKPSAFFFVEPNFDPAQRKPNNQQMTFMFTHYPQYGMNQVTMLDWLYQEAFKSEEYERSLVEAQAAYAQPQQRLINPDADGEEESTFGFKGGKKPRRGKQTVVADKKEIIKRKEKDPVKEAAKEEFKKQKVFKDQNVEVDEAEIVEVDMTREPCSLVLIGHVDAGKSTISGQIMYLSGCVDSRTIEKYKKEAKDKGRDSWWLAYVMDVNDDEKAKGKTIEVGRATFDTPSKAFTIFDAPGHKNYVPNMITGAACADYGGLVISARRGEFEAGFEKDGQTREHVQLAKSLGVKRLVIIVNKMDEASVKWNKARWEEIRTGLTPFLHATGYKDEDIDWVPISAMTGQNIKEPVDKLQCSWWNGPTLLELLDKQPVEPRFPDGPLRIPILDKMKDVKIIAHGKVESGTVRVGDKLALAPSNQPIQVGGILNGKNEAVRFARPGENVQIKLIHIEREEEIEKGMVMTPRDNLIPVSNLFEVELELLELLDYKPIMSKGYTCMIHMHTFGDDCTIKDIVQSQHKDPGSGEWKTVETPKFIRSFSKARCRMTTRLPVPLEKFSTIPQLGRFTLRDEGKTIAVGRIVRYKPYHQDASQTAATAKSDAKILAEKLASATITENVKQPVDSVFNLETGEIEQEKPALEGIKEEDE